MQLIDYAKIQVKAGDDGRGCVSFRREKYVPRGGPNGGDGGRGGHVIIRASSKLNTLLDQKYKREYKAARGQHGMGKKMHGKNAEDLIISVPVGTVVGGPPMKLQSISPLRRCHAAVSLYHRAPSFTPGLRSRTRSGA